jgi:hypothetical protein
MSARNRVTPGGGLSTFMEEAVRPLAKSAKSMPQGRFPQMQELERHL